MSRLYNKTRQCVECGATVPRKVLRCRDCNQAFLQRRPAYERTVEHRAMMSEALRGRQNSWNNGRKRSPETAAKIAAYWTPERREAARQRGLAHASDPQWRAKIGEALSGARNPGWEDGRSEIPYGPGWGRVNRALVRERAGYRCEMCGQSKPLDTHHIDGSKDNHTLENPRALCRKCHKAAHSRMNRR